MFTNKNNYKKGSTVFWKWGRGKIKGTIEEVYFNTIEKEIKGSKIKRNGSKENPAYLIREDKDKDKEGKHVLKLHSELVE